VKNRMLEIGSYGSVRGRGGNIPTYSDQDPEPTLDSATQHEPLQYCVCRPMPCRIGHTLLFHAYGTNNRERRLVDQSTEDDGQSAMLYGLTCLEGGRVIEPYTKPC
jgi:hypothetical protein